MLNIVRVQSADKVVERQRLFRRRLAKHRMECPIRNESAFRYVPIPEAGIRRIQGKLQAVGHFFQVADV